MTGPPQLVRDRSEQRLLDGEVFTDGACAAAARRVQIHPQHLVDQRLERIQPGLARQNLLRGSGHTDASALARLRGVPAPDETNQSLSPRR
jgi:hypothetical protein